MKRADLQLDAKCIELFI